MKKISYLSGGVLYKKIRLGCIIQDKDTKNI